MKQICLNAKGCSGRGVRLAVLTSPQRIAIKEQTAKALNPSSTVGEWNDAQTTAGIIAMLVGVTEKDGFAKAQDTAAPDVVWRTPSVEDLETSLPTLFNVKDIDALGKWFSRFHDVTEAELDAMLGEALDVTAA